MDATQTSKIPNRFGKKQSEKVKETSKKTRKLQLENRKLSILKNANPNHLKVLDIIAEKGRRGEKIVKGEVLREAGYSKTLQQAPSKVFERRSFLELADELLPDDLILNSLRTDILKKPQRRYQELALGAKIKGMLIDRVEQKTTVQGFIVLPERQRPDWYTPPTDALPAQQTHSSLDNPASVVPAIEGGEPHQEPERML